MFPEVKLKGTLRSRGNKTYCFLLAIIYYHELVTNEGCNLKRSPPDLYIYTCTVYAF